MASPLDSVDDTGIPDGVGRRRRSASGRLHVSPAVAQTLTSIASVALVVIVWWVAADYLVRDPVILPTPSGVAAKAQHLAFPAPGALSIWPQIGESVERVLIGWGLAVVAGVPFGALMASSRVMRAGVDPILESGRAVPPLAFAPLLVVWFGIGEVSKDLLLFSAAFPIIAISSAAGVAGINPIYLRAAKTLGASRWYLMRHVIIPAALPSIMTSMRVTISLTWATLVAAELVASTNGLGWMILQASRFLDTSTIFVGIGVIGIIAYCMDRAVRVLEHYLVPWKGRA